MDEEDDGGHKVQKNEENEEMGEEEDKENREEDEDDEGDEGPRRTREQGGPWDNGWKSTMPYLVSCNPSPPHNIPNRHWLTMILGQ